MIGVDTIIGDGVAALSCALFAARYGPVRLCGKPSQQRRATVESVPAATLTLLLELGITVDELDVNRLTRDRLVAWEITRPQRHRGPVCAHLDNSALHAALWRRVEAEPAITLTHRVQPADARPGWVDASGRRAVTARTHLRPPRTWTAATVTVQTPAASTTEIQLAAAPCGYAYRLGSAHATTIGWVGPDRPPRNATDLRARIENGGAGWLLADDILAATAAPTLRRPASMCLPVVGGPAIPIGDAALTRDALAAQGLSIGLSDARLVTDPSITAAAMSARRADAAARHLRHLSTMIAACAYAHTPAWSQYHMWLTALAEDGSVPLSAALP
jgi:2-polyprenyl-6-methoxyphenol hydroxylase-like FAD-dependent oxidoreductase